MLSPGQRVSGFEVVRWLGRGAFHVYEARLVAMMHRLVALKVLTGEQCLLEALLNEVRLTALVDHPNVIKLFDCGLYADPDSGRSCLYVVTELAKGGSLRDLIQERGRFPIAAAARTAVLICEGLTYAHRRGIVHGDVKPANVLLTKEGVPKLADFGVGRLLVETQASTTVAGTVPYMAPEAWEGFTHQSDIWSVGAVLYEMLSGQQPFSGCTPAEAELRVCTSPHVPLRELRPKIAPGLEATVDKALEKQSARRYTRAEDLAYALQPYCSGRQPPAVPGIAGGSSDTGGPCSASLALQSDAAIRGAVTCPCCGHRLVSVHYG